jgi:hypothetical protein
MALWPRMLVERSQVNAMQKWTQDQAVAFECARECIVELMAICSAELGDLAGQADVCAESVDRQERRLADLATELRNLHLPDTDNIERIRRDYGQQVREYRAEALTQG